MNSLRPRNYAREIDRSTKNFEDAGMSNLSRNTWRSWAAYLLIVAIAIIGGLYSLHVVS